MSSLKLLLRKSGRLLVALAVSVLAIGCADIAPDKREPVAAGSIRVCYEHITITGRFSARYSKNGKDEVVHGNFNWIQSGHNTSVTLLSPLGQTVAIIEVTPSAATLTPAGQPPRTAADVDALAAASLGWPLPVSGLREWLQGCAQDAQGRRFVATQARNSVNTPDGWRILYPTWEKANAVLRPKRIDLHRVGDRSVADISLRIVIDEWQPR